MKLFLFVTIQLQWILHFVNILSFYYSDVHWNFSLGDIKGSYGKQPTRCMLILYCRSFLCSNNLHYFRGRVEANSFNGGRIGKYSWSKWCWCLFSQCWLYSKCEEFKRTRPCFCYATRGYCKFKHRYQSYKFFLCLGATPIASVFREVLRNKRHKLKERKLLILLATDGVPTDNWGREDIASLENLLKLERNPPDRFPMTIIACTGIHSKCGIIF